MIATERRGANTQHTLASILRTGQQRGLDSTEVLTALLRAPKPIASPQLLSDGSCSQRTR